MKTMNGLVIPNGLDEICQIYGDPRALMSPDGTISDANELAWRKQILAMGHLPKPIPLSGGGVKSTFGAHRKLVGAFEGVFGDLLAAGLYDLVKSWGGIYNLRAKRGLGNLSVHSWAAAIDLNPETNQLGTAGDMDPRMVEIFEKRGFSWGGKFKRLDPMHYQAATGY